MKQVLINQFNFHQKLFNNVLDGFSDDETNRRLYDDRRMNHVKYIAGHLLNARYSLALLGGVKAEPKWQELFAPMGQSRAKDDIIYPSIDEIKSEWNGIYEPIRSGLNELSTQDLNRIPPEPLDKVFENSPVFDNKIASFWAFLNHHQAYHIGQIGILRRGFGKEPMRYD